MTAYFIKKCACGLLLKFTSIGTISTCPRCDAKVALQINGHKQTGLRTENPLELVLPGFKNL